MNALQKGLRALRLPHAAEESAPRRVKDVTNVSNTDGITESLRRLANEVDAELSALRAAAAEHARRREEAERLLDAARDELRRMEGRAARQRANAQGRDVLAADEVSEVVAATLMTELCKAQTRAAAAEKRGDAMVDELAEMRQGFEKKQADMVLATALWCFMGLTVLTYLARMSASLKFL
jgi:chromosome segregation ATPase